MQVEVAVAPSPDDRGVAEALNPQGVLVGPGGAAVDGAGETGEAVGPEAVGVVEAGAQGAGRPSILPLTGGSSRAQSSRDALAKAGELGLPGRTARPAAGGDLERIWEALVEVFCVCDGAGPVGECPILDALEARAREGAAGISQS